jgi:ferrous iron transport protein B
MTLAELQPGHDAIITSVDCDEASLRKHILDMGLTPGTEITMVKAAPLGDPLELRLRGYELTLRKADAARVNLSDIHPAHDLPGTQPKRSVVPHPGVGEAARKEKSREVIPGGKSIHFALAGNQNCGKTTLFNQLTGANQHVGNFPGVTVDRKDGVIRQHSEATVTDLPGIYSLSPYTSEEIVTREFLLNEHPGCHQH